MALDLRERQSLVRLLLQHLTKMYGGYACIYEICRRTPVINPAVRAEQL